MRILMNMLDLTYEFNVLIKSTLYYIMVYRRMFFDGQGIIIEA
jgi:hypothetical protein